MSADVEAPPSGAIKWDNARMKLNVDPSIIPDHIRANVKRFLPQLSPHQPNTVHIALVGGGWSLNDPEVYEELRAVYFLGTKLVALNGAANWLMERNLRPSLHLVMDAREANLPFVEKAVPGCKYMLASQCHPKMFDACEGRDVTIFHVISGNSEEETQILDDHYMKRWMVVPGAGTIGIVGIMLCRILGFRFQHMFGIDSCYAPDGRHHAYEQKINDDEGSAPFWCAGRKFRCSAWQASQANNFLQVIKHHGQELQISVHGDGVLAHMVRTGASLLKEE